MTDDDFKLSAEKQYRIKKDVPNLNYSAINTFIDCPLRYSLIYNYDFTTPPSYMQRVGTFIHNSLQQIHEHLRKGEDISPRDMKNIVDRYWINLPISEKKNNELKEKKVEELVTYYVYAKDNYKEIIDEYVNNDIMIHLGDHEGLGLGFYEALYSRIPILTLNCQPNNEIIKHLKNGWLIECNYEKLKKEKVI